MAKLFLFLEREELNKLQYPIIVERWDKKNDGKLKRLFKQEFTTKERQKLYELQKLFHNWYLVKGTPKMKQFNPNTVDLIKRAVHFFATN